MEEGNGPCEAREEHIKLVLEANKQLRNKGAERK